MHRHRLHQNLSVDCRHYPSCQAPPQPPHLQHNRPIPIQQWSGHHAPASHCPSGAVMTPMYGLPHQSPNGGQRPANLRPPQITHHRQWMFRHDCQASYHDSILLGTFHLSISTVPGGWHGGITSQRLPHGQVAAPPSADCL